MRAVLGARLADVVSKAAKRRVKSPGWRGVERWRDYESRRRMRATRSARRRRPRAARAKTYAKTPVSPRSSRADRGLCACTKSFVELVRECARPKRSLPGGRRPSLPREIRRLLDTRNAPQTGRREACEADLQGTFAGARMSMRRSRMSASPPYGSTVNPTGARGRACSSGSRAAPRSSSRLTSGPLRPRNRDARRPRTLAPGQRHVDGFGAHGEFHDGKGSAHDVDAAKRL